LGLITMLLGTGTAYGALVAVFHILNHATFKAALFMSAGIGDHETGTRDITRLGGLRTLMPITFLIAAIAALSMAGIPLFNGFISKEMMLKETTKTVLFGVPLLVPVLATIGALFSAAYSFRYIGHTFLGPERDDYPAKPHDPGIGMWGPPALLCVLVVGIGVAPFLAEPLVFLVTEAVLGNAAALPDEHLKIWHGVNAALWMSVIAVVGGLMLLAAYNPVAGGWAVAGPPAAKAIFDAIIDAIVSLATVITARLHDGALTRYAAIFGVTVVALGTHAYFTGTATGPTREMLPMQPVAVMAWVLLVTATAVLLAYHNHRYLALILTSIVGLVIAMGFAYLSAPDLALTQISVEVVTAILLLLALNFLPRETPAESSSARRMRDGVIAGAAGLGAGALIYSMLMRDALGVPISEYHLANSYKGGGGTNVVN
ncbi:MAG: hydrogen gas-evolving membrane-bound hydrogenase subunit E, partial [Pseudomonadota bacterium]